MMTESRGRTRVLCLVPYPTTGPSNRLRVEQYAPHLAKLGVDLRIAPFLDEATYGILYREGRTLEKMFGVARGLLRRVRDLARSRQYDLVLVHRETAPFGPALIERVLRRSGMPYVFDFDDAIWLPAAHPANRRWTAFRPPGRVDEVVRHATAVIAGNEYLARWARERNGNVTVIPTAVDTERHLQREPHQKSDPIVIGWVGSTTTAPYLRLLDGVFELLAAQSSILVRVVGGSYRSSSVRVEERPYRLKSEAREIELFDIGVMPQPDDRWARGKSAFKAVLYMATGVPVVASDVGVTREVVGRGGFVVGTVEEWIESLRTLIDEPALRQCLGMEGRRRAETHYSVDVLAPRFAAVLRQAASLQQNERR